MAGRKREPDACMTGIQNMREEIGKEDAQTVKPINNAANPQENK